MLLSGRLTRHSSQCAPKSVAFKLSYSKLKGHTTEHLEYDSFNFNDITLGEFEPLYQKLLEEQRIIKVVGYDIYGSQQGIRVGNKYRERCARAIVRCKKNNNFEVRIEAQARDRSDKEFRADDPLRNAISLLGEILGEKG